ncbi:MAG: MFS transporter [Acidobacteria bacterium]|nr:MFS transporter [Acidobacteriota bacterium]
MPQEQPQPAEYNFSKRQITLGLVAIFAVYGTMSYFVQTLTIARPKMAADLDGMPLYAWAVSIPSLVTAFATLIFGKFSDIYGRRIMLLISVIVCLVGTVLSAISPTFVFLIVASVIGSVGSGAMMPLVFSVVGDLFPPSKRSKWIGLLNIPVGIFSLFGPTMGGWFVDNLSWRYLYWMSLPLLIICLLTVPIGVPSIRRADRGRIDVLGCILVAIASSATIIGLSFAGDKYPWGSVQVIGLLGIALLFWILFFLVEGRAEEAILDPVVLRNRSFLTIAVAGFFSFFAQMGILMYFPMFLQGVQSISATRSGQIITPYSVLMSFIGVPVGFLLARSRHYKWMYVAGFAILTATMFGVIFFTEKTPVAWSVLVAILSGLGLGAMPTVNTMVIQSAVPKRLLGVAMGASFFNLMMGVAISPAILGAAMNATYAKTLAASLPAELRQVADETTMQSLGNSRVLLSETALKNLENTFKKMGSDGEALFPRTVQAIRTSMLAGVKSVFWISAITMLLSFFIILTLPEINLDDGTPNKP